MPLGAFEIILIIVVIALLFGAKKLPELMKGMGQGIREFKQEVKDPAAPASPPVVDIPSKQLDSVVVVEPTVGGTVSTESAAPVGERR